MALDVSGSSSLFWKTGISTAGLEKGAMKSKGILMGLASSITKMDIFVGLGISAALVFSKISKQAYNFSKEFETAMKEVQTISKAVENNFKGISQEIINMSKTVPDTALKLTKALYQIVSAGYDGAKAMDILRTSTELAVATVTDTFTAADVLTYVMNAYGKAAGTAAEISDKLFTIIRLGKVKMEELGPTLSMVTGLAAEAGMSFNDLGAFYAEAVKKIQPHIVSTGIRGFVTALLRASKEGQQSAKAAKEMGIEFDIATLKSKGLEYMLKQMSEATEGQKQKLMELFPNVRGLIGLLAIMTNEGANYNKTLNEIENSLGATDKAFKTMVETTESQWAILKNNVMAKMKPLGDSLLRTMNDIASGINIAMSGANVELSKLARSYSELTDTLRRKQSIIDDLIKTVEDLRSKTELTKDETIELEAAERALAVYFPTLGKAARFAGANIDVLTLAKEGTKKLSLEIMELEVERAEIERKQAQLAISRYEANKDEANKEVERIKTRMELRKKMIQLENEGLKGAWLRKDQIDEIIKSDTEHKKLVNELAMATEAETLREIELNLALKETTIMVDAKKEAYERLIELQSKPIITPKPERKYGIPPIIKEDVVIPVLTDEQVKAVEDNLRYMASQYKKYLADVAQYGELWVEENNALLAEEGKNYRKFLSKMAIDYEGNADLKRQISEDIYEYNKGILAKRKEAEEELFNLLADNREKDLAAEEKRYNELIKEFKKGSAERLDIEKQYRINKEAINKEYDEKEAKLRLDLFKAGLEKLTGETDKAYKSRLEIAKVALGKQTKINREYFKFIKDKLQEIAKLEKEEAEEKREILESYFKSYQTTEEKIASIHERTIELLKLTDDEYERSRLKNIEKILIAEIEANEAMRELNKELDEYGEKLNNQELENYIRFLEEMKIKYSGFADAIILLNEKIAESQKQIWENTRNEINQTADLLHNLASVVGEFDSELSQMINNIANLVGGIGQITFGFATGNIFGILGGIITAISSIFNLFVIHYSDVAEIEEELHEITLELQAQHDILSLAIGTEKPEAIQNIIDLLHEQIAVYNEMIEAEQEAYGQFLWWTWSETDQAAIEQWLATIQDINVEIAILNQQYQEILTGTTTEAIANAIAEGFSQGLDSAQIFADTFNEMMKKAIIDAFKRTIITKYLEEWYEQFALLSGGGLTTEEINILAQEYLNILESATTEWEAILSIMEAVGIELEDIIGETTKVTYTGMYTSLMSIAEELGSMLAHLPGMADSLRNFIIAMEEAGYSGIEIAKILLNTTIPSLEAMFGEMAGFENIRAELEAIIEAEEGMKEVAGITRETIADAIAEGFLEGLKSAEVFADTFNDMMRDAIINAFKETIIAKYIKNWYDQFAILYEGGLTVEEIKALTGTYQNVVKAAETQWKTMEAVLEMAGVGFEEVKKIGLRGAIAGITEETAGLLAGQFQAIRINTVEMLSHMESIIIINSRIADNTEFNKYLKHLKSIDDKLSGVSSESEAMRGTGGV